MWALNIISESEDITVMNYTRPWHPAEKPASWHASFIAEQRAAGQVQPHLLAMLEVLLQEAEREYGGELPEGWWCKSPNGWHLIWKNAGNIVSLNLAVSGTLQLVTMDETLLLFEPLALAATLREMGSEKGFVAVENLMNRQWLDEKREGE